MLIDSCTSKNKCSIFVLSKRATTDHMELSNPWIMTSMTEELNFYLNFILINSDLNSYVWFNGYHIGLCRPRLTFILLLCFDIDLKHRFLKWCLGTNNKALGLNYLHSKWGSSFTSNLVLGVVLHFSLPQCPQLAK